MPHDEIAGELWRNTAMPPQERAPFPRLEEGTEDTDSLLGAIGAMVLAALAGGALRGRGAAGKLYGRPFPRGGPGPKGYGGRAGSVGLPEDSFVRNIRDIEEMESTLKEIGRRPRPGTPAPSGPPLRIRSTQPPRKAPPPESAASAVEPATPDRDFATDWARMQKWPPAPAPETMEARRGLRDLELALALARAEEPMPPSPFAGQRPRITATDGARRPAPEPSVADLLELPGMAPEVSGPRGLPPWLMPAAGIGALGGAAALLPRDGPPPYGRPEGPLTDLDIAAAFGRAGGSRADIGGLPAIPYGREGGPSSAMDPFAFPSPTFAPPPEPEPEAPALAAMLGLSPETEPLPPPPAPRQRRPAPEPELGLPRIAELAATIPERRKTFGLPEIARAEQLRRYRELLASRGL